MKFLEDPNVSVLNPLHHRHEQLEAGFIPYGVDKPERTCVQIVDTFGQYEAEYAAIRKSVGLIDLPHRGLVRVTGRDRTDFLHRLLTNDTKGLAAGQGCRGFLLGKKGRIEADVTVLHSEEQTLLELDATDAASVVEGLDKYVFSEDVALVAIDNAYVHLALHGPGTVTILCDATGNPIDTLKALNHQRVTIAGSKCAIFRFDDTGSPGLHLLVPVDDAVAVYDHLLNLLQNNGGWAIGWSAYNTARIEAGTPIYHIDFGPDSLPHETGLLDQTVSFTKGCYVGQEIVARMNNLGHPKRVLTGLRFEDDHLPIAGTEVFKSQKKEIATPTDDSEHRTTDSDTVVGAITSSCISPMLGNTAIALAVLRWDTRKHGTKVFVPAEGRVVPATVCALPFL